MEPEKGITHPIAQHYIEAGKKGLPKARKALAEAIANRPYPNPWENK